MNQSQRKKQENPRLQRNDEQVEPLGLLYTGEDGLLSHWWFWLTFSPVIISRSREIRGRIADQANKLIRHFYGLGAHLSASNFPGAATTPAYTADGPRPRAHSKAPHRAHRPPHNLKTPQAPTPKRRRPSALAPFFPPASTQFWMVAKGTNTR